MPVPTGSADEIRETLEILSQHIGPRPAASGGQKRAAQYLTRRFRDLGLEVEVQTVPAARWDLEAVHFQVGGRALEVLANPHSPSCDVTGQLLWLDRLEPLRQADLTGSIAVLGGELVDGSFFPRNFDLFRIPGQDEVLDLLEAKRPLAAVLVNPSAALVPILEDADFDLPSATVSREVGEQVRDASGQTAALRIAASQGRGAASTVIARGPAVTTRRRVICAHYDTKHYTPGAYDNGSGVAAMLCLAALLRADGDLSGLEFVAFGGEDSWYPADAGYLVQNAHYMPTIAAVLNIDGIGLTGHRDTFALLGCPDELANDVRRTAAGFPGVGEKGPWYESDHSLFVYRGIPALAITSESSPVGPEPLTHTSRDTLDLLDPIRIAGTVRFLHAVLRQALR